MEIMAGKLSRSQAFLLKVVVTLAVTFNGVICNHATHQHGVAVPHLCQADSSEECNFEQDSTISPLSSPKYGPLAATEFQVRYILYKGDGKEYTFTNDNFETSRIQFIPGAPLKVLIHGFLNTGKTTFPVNIREAYMQRMKAHPNESYNVIAYDWGDGACASVSNVLQPYRNAVENVETSGRKLGDMLTKLHQLGIFDVSKNVHLIGHSLGSHVAGQASRRIYNNLGRILHRVSALDPAGPLFWRDKLFIGPRKPYPRLHRNRVQFLDVYHTSFAFGSNEEMGDVDFFVNGGQDQASCDIEITVPIFKWKIPVPTLRTFLQVCSHNYATEIFAKSINDKTMKGCTGCYSYSEFSQGKCDCEDTPVMGEFVVEEQLDGYPIASGTAYVKTPRDTSVGSNYLQMLRTAGIFDMLYKGWKVLCL